LLPGARWDDKRWPVKNFVELVRRLSPLAPNHKFAILGGNSDRALGQQIAAANPERCLDLTGQTSLPEMIEWLRATEVVITNDTGPMHIAAALRKPIIALFGPTEPDSTGPYGQHKNVLQDRSLPCVPCQKSTCTYHEPLACLYAITPQMVCEKAVARLTS
jgi:heptosyltransferase-1/heptosyltransferase-2